MKLNLKELWKEYTDEEYYNFDRIPVEARFSNRADLHAFILLDKLIPNQDDYIVAAVGHDTFYLDIEEDELSKVATKENIIDLIRCGILFDGETFHIHR